MSLMSARHREMLEYLFDMQGGYLLRFTNDSFRRFMILHADIEILMCIMRQGMMKSRRRQKSLGTFFQMNQMH